MEPRLVRSFLRALRRLRGGSADLGAAPPGVRRLVNDNLAGTCRALVLWADAEVEDPRAADAFVRAYGLGRMPETRSGIGRSLRSATGRLGISPAAVDDLLRTTEEQLAGPLDALVVPRRWGQPTPSAWVDPFPAASSRSAVRRQLLQVLYTAWADVPEDAVHDCVDALLLYEEEHGLRRPPGQARHREQRRRLRRLAWSMLTVARERHVGKQPDDVVVDLLFGPRRFAVVEHLPEEAAAIFLAPAGLPADQIDQTLEYVRGAVRHGRAEAPELLGLLRESVARSSRRAAPPALTAAMAALTTIVAREQRHAGGALAASEAVVLALEAGDRLAQLPAREAERRQQQVMTVHFGLRAAQEAAELHDVLGDTAAAWRSLRRMAKLVPLLEDADPDEVQSWRQQHLQTRSTMARHMALRSRHGEAWLRQAERDASRSLELVESEGLSAGFRLVPTSQLLATAITGLRFSASDRPDRERLEQAAWRRLDQAMAASAAVDGRVDRPTQSARLSVARRWWELALLTHEPSEVDRARQAARQLVQPRTLAQDREKLERLEAMTWDRRSSLGPRLHPVR